MFPPSLGPLGALLSANAERAAPEPLPSLPLAGAAQLPMAPPGSMAPAPPMPDPRPQPDLSQHHSAAEFVRQLAPLLMTTIAGMRNPRHGAAIAQGIAQGMGAARREQVDAEHQDADRQRLQTHFMDQMMATARTIKDPHQLQQYMAMVEPIGVEQFGMQPGWSTKMPVPKTDALDTLKGELAQKLATFDKDKRWAGVAGTPQEGKISFTLSNGQHVSVASARRLMNQQLMDEKGMPAYAPAASDEAPENKTDYSRFLTRYAKKLGKNSANDLTADEEVSARKAFGQADDRTPKGVDPVMAQIHQLQLDLLNRNNASEVTPGQASIANQLSDNFRAESKDFNQVSQAYNRVRASAADPSAAGDLALIFNYMKTLDPGSTVREGEFATAQNAGGIDDRIVAMYNKVRNGERLAPTQRADFLDRAKRLYTQALGQQRRIENQYKRRATAAGVAPDLVVTDYSVSEDAPANPASAAPALPAAPAPPKPKGQNVKWSRSMNAWVEVTGRTPDGKPIVRKVQP